MSKTAPVYEPGKYHLEVVPMYETQFRGLEVHSYLDAAITRADLFRKVAGNRTRVVLAATGEVIYTSED